MRQKYCEKFDVHFDYDTGKYLEPKCSSKICAYCSKRPKNILKYCKTCDMIFSIYLKLKEEETKNDTL